MVDAIARILEIRARSLKEDETDVEPGVPFGTFRRRPGGSQ
jgi:hypothetical protein